MTWRRSASLSPPQTPWRSRIETAYSRHAELTEHWPQMALARASRSARSWRRSPSGGGKNVRDCGPRHAARCCQSISATTAVTQTPPGDVTFAWTTKIGPPFGLAQGPFGKSPTFPQALCTTRYFLVNTRLAWGKLWAQNPDSRPFPLLGRRSFSVGLTVLLSRSTVVRDNREPRLPRVQPREPGLRRPQLALGRQRQPALLGWCEPSTAHR